MINYLLQLTVHGCHWHPLPKANDAYCICP